MDNETRPQRPFSRHSQDAWRGHGFCEVETEITFLLRALRSKKRSKHIASHQSEDFTRPLS